MATESLKIQITADNRAAVAALKETSAAMGGVQIQAAKNGAAVAASGQGMSKAAVNYQNFGRVLQDLPYGFNGVANNLTQLIPSVGMLGLAFSGVVTALTFMQVGFGAWTKGMGGASEAADDLKKKMDGFQESAAKEIINFQKLADVAKNANIPLEQRLQAVDELQSQYPAYLGNLSKEDILAGKTGGAYDKIVSALKAKIALQAAEERIIPIIKEQLIVSDKIAESQKAVAAAAGLTAKDYAASTMNGRNYAKELQAGAVGAAKSIETQSKAYNELEKKIQKVFNSMSALNAASNGLNLNPTKDGKASPWATRTFQGQKKDTQGGTVQTLGIGSGYNGGGEKQLNEQMTLRTQGFIAQQQAIMAATNAQMLLNEQMALANQLSEMGASLFTSMGNALLYGQDMGEAFSNTIKKMVMDLAAAVAQALIFQGIMALITGGTSIAAGGFGGAGGGALGGIGASIGNSMGSSSGGGIFGFLSGNNILMGQNRTRTSMGFRR